MLAMFKLVELILSWLQALNDRQIDENRCAGLIIGPRGVDHVCMCVCVCPCIVYVCVCVCVCACMCTDFVSEHAVCRSTDWVHHFISLFCWLFVSIKFTREFRRFGVIQFMCECVPVNECVNECEWVNEQASERQYSDGLLRWYAYCFSVCWLTDYCWESVCNKTSVCLLTSIISSFVFKNVWEGVFGMFLVHYINRPFHYLICILKFVKTDVSVYECRHIISICLANYTRLYEVWDDIK